MLNRLRTSWEYVSRHPLWSATLAGAFVAAGVALFTVLNGAEGSTEAASRTPERLDQVAPKGPQPRSRPTLRCRLPTDCPGASFVTFNAFTNAPNYGDERAFIDVKDAQIQVPGQWGDQTFVPRQVRSLVFRVYVNNGADSGLIGEPVSTARETIIRIALPRDIGRTHVVTAEISAANATPQAVSDTAAVYALEPTVLFFDRKPPRVSYRPNGVGEFVTRAVVRFRFRDDQTLEIYVGDWRAGFNFSALFTVAVSLERVRSRV